MLGKVKSPKQTEKIRGPKNGAWENNKRFEWFFEKKRDSGGNPRIRHIRRNAVTDGQTNPGNHEHAFRIPVVDKH